MCFNASASFTAAAVIGVAGIATIKKSKTASQLPFSFIPIIFSLQQLIEGFLWVAFNHGEYMKWQPPLTHAFIFIAQIVWPFWVPLSMFLIEKNKKRKRGVAFLSVIGLLSSLFGSYRLLFFHVSSQIEEHHIRYIFDYSSPLLTFTPVFYVLAIVLSPFISSIKKMILLGIFISASLLLSVLFFERYTVSVWCFFAATISVVVFLIVREMNLVPEKEVTL